MVCDCPICNGRDINQLGITFANKEVIPFVKIHLLKLKYPNHPIPYRYNGLLSSLMAYSQAVSYDKLHGNSGRKYYTDNIWILKFKNELNNKFSEVLICSKSEMEDESICREVCEYNVS